MTGGSEHTVNNLQYDAEVKYYEGLEINVDERLYNESPLLKLEIREPENGKNVLL